MRNHYEVLGVPPSATFDQIKDRYRFLAHAYHPDKFASEQHKQRAEEQFKAINEAYETLKDPARRRAYDAERLRSQPPPTASHPTKPRHQASRRPSLIALGGITVLVVALVWIGQHNQNPSSAPTKQPITPSSRKNTRKILAENMTMSEVEDLLGKPDSVAEEQGNIDVDVERPTVIIWAYKRYPKTSSGAQYGQPGYINFVPDRFTRFCKDPEEADRIAHQHGEQANSFRSCSYEGSFPTEPNLWSELGDIGGIPLKTRREATKNQ